MTVCKRIAKNIWIWCLNRKINLTVTFIPGKHNVEADKKSRKFNDRTEWRLNPTMSTTKTTTTTNCQRKVLSVSPNTDLLASRLSFQIKPFTFWGPDQDTMETDVFTVDWNRWITYTLPPFSLIQRIIRKIGKDQVEGLVILLWPTTE